MILLALTWVLKNNKISVMSKIYFLMKVNSGILASSKKCVYAHIHMHACLTGGGRGSLDKGENNLGIKLTTNAYVEMDDD